MPNFTIQKEGSENEPAIPSWAFVPSPGHHNSQNSNSNSQELVPVSDSRSSRRYSDSYTHHPEGHAANQKTNAYAPTTEQPFEFANNASTGVTFYFSTQIININSPSEPQTDRNNEPPPVQVEEVESDTDMSAPSATRSRDYETQDDTGFFNWAEFREEVLPKKRTAMRSNHDEVIDAFSELEAGPVKGLGRLAKPLINKYHTSAYLSEFQASGERVILRPCPPEDAEPTTPTTTRSELERLECELFDVSKYLGNTNYLTVLTWASDSHWGTITLFEVDVSETDRAVDWTKTSGRRRKGAPQEGLKIRPIAAMKDVPKAILVNIRVDQDVRKTVLENTDNGFRWRSQVRPGPSYARVARSRSLSPSHHPLEKGSPRSGRSNDSRAAGSDSEDYDADYTPKGTYAIRGRRRTRCGADVDVGSERHSPKIHGDLPDARRRPRRGNLLRAEDALSSSPRHRTRSSRSRGRGASGKAETDPETGIVATIPQFMALLHANRSILEVVSSFGGSETVEVDAEGDGRGGGYTTTMRSITIAEKPVGRRHTGRDVHVVVLMPNGSSWAEERIFWTDERGELADLRQKVFWDVIERGRSFGGGRSGGSKSGKMRESRSIDGRGSGRRTGGRRNRERDERSRSPPKSARW